MTKEAKRIAGMVTFTPGVSKGEIAFLAYGLWKERPANNRPTGLYSFIGYLAMRTQRDELAPYITQAIHIHKSRA